MTTLPLLVAQPPDGALAAALSGGGAVPDGGPLNVEYEGIVEAVFADDFESGDTAAWSVVAP